VPPRDAFGDRDGAPEHGSGRPAGWDNNTARTRHSDASVGSLAEH
jgi:hypothetical protein